MSKIDKGKLFSPGARFVPLCTFFLVFGLLLFYVTLCKIVQPEMREVLAAWDRSLEIEGYKMCFTLIIIS